MELRRWAEKTGNERERQKGRRQEKTERHKKQDLDGWNGGLTDGQTRLG